MNSFSPSSSSTTSTSKHAKKHELLVFSLDMNCCLPISAFEAISIFIPLLFLILTLCIIFLCRRRHKLDTHKMEKSNKTCKHEISNLSKIAAPVQENVDSMKVQKPPIVIPPQENPLPLRSHSPNEDVLNQPNIRPLVLPTVQNEPDEKVPTSPLPRPPSIGHSMTAVSEVPMSPRRRENDPVTEEEGTTTMEGTKEEKSEGREEKKRLLAVKQEERREEEKEEKEEEEKRKREEMRRKEMERREKERMKEYKRREKEREEEERERNVEQPQERKERRENRREKGEEGEKKERRERREEKRMEREEKKKEREEMRRERNERPMKKLEETREEPPRNAYEGQRRKILQSAIDGDKQDNQNDGNMSLAQHTREYLHDHPSSESTDEMNERRKK